MSRAAASVLWGVLGVLAVMVAFTVAGLLLMFGG